MSSLAGAILTFCMDNALIDYLPTLIDQRLSIGVLQDRFKVENEGVAPEPEQ